MTTEPTNPPSGLEVHLAAFARTTTAQMAVHLRSDHDWTAWTPRADERAALLAAHQVAHAEQETTVICYLPPVPPPDAADRDAEARTRYAVRALTLAARTEPDFAGWLGDVLAAVAAEIGGPHRLIAGRPGAWEAHHVIALAGGDSW
jgi:hypothetical protein